MARVNCHLPDELKERALEELPPDVSFASILRVGLIAYLDGQTEKPVRTVRRGATTTAR